MADNITAITLPKWGLSMQEGCVSTWHVSEGDHLEKGAEVVDIETEKINNTLEAPVSGVLHRVVAKEGDEIPVGALLGVMAPAYVSQEDIDAFVNDFED